MAGKYLCCLFLLSLLILPTNSLSRRSWLAQQGPFRESPSQNISIVSPPDGTVVEPGEILQVDVSVASSTPVRMVAIISPLGMSDKMRESPPWSFTLMIPKKDGAVGGGGPLLGRHPVYAAVALRGADGSLGASIVVDVERPDIPIKLWTQGSTIRLETFGEEEPIIISGVFSDGSNLELNESSRLSFASSNANVATVDGHGTVTAVAPGHAFITATYRHENQHVQVPIPVDFSPPAMNVEPGSLAFAEQQVGTLSAPLRVILTNRTHGPMKIYRLKISGDFSESDDCEALSPLREEGGTCAVSVVFSPRIKGLRLGKIDVANSFSEIITTIHLSGKGR